MTRKKNKRKTDGDPNRKASEDSGPTLRIHMGRPKQGSIVGALAAAATSTGAMPHRAYGSFYMARQISSVIEAETNIDKRKLQKRVSKSFIRGRTSFTSENFLFQSSGDFQASQPISRQGSIQTPETLRSEFEQSSISSPLLKPDYSPNTPSFRHRPSADNSISNGTTVRRSPSTSSFTAKVWISFGR